MFTFGRFFLDSVNKRLFIPNLTRCQMAPITRNKKTLDDATTVTKSKANIKLGNKASPKPRSVVVNKRIVKSNKVQTGKDGLPIIPFPSQSELDEWLRINHTIATGIWVKIAKKSSGILTVTYDEMLDAALCYGWIDGQRCGLDEMWFLQRITPRRPKSNWSQINREKVKRLIRIGKMKPAGQRLIDEAKADGRWDNASKPTSGCVVPDELLAAIEASSPAVVKLFAAMSKPYKLALLNRIQESTSEETKSEHIKSIVAMLERGETNVPSLQ